MLAGTPPSRRSVAPRLSRFLACGGLAAMIAGGFAACTSPSSPTPPAKTPAGPGVQSPAAPPTIVSIAASTSRAEVDQDVDLTAVVIDPNPSGDKLTYVWLANVGAFTGSGPSVKWRLTKGTAATPASVTFTLVVVQSFPVDAAGSVGPGENRVSQSATLVQVHDSPAEISKMVLHFLVDLFGNSSVPPDACLVDFSDSCPGKEAERSDIITNRANFLISSAEAQIQSITFDSPPPAATVAVVVAPCSFHDHNFQTGRDGISSGDCDMTAVFQNERWWLCTSSFDNGVCGSCLRARRMTMQEFFMAGIRR